jgi:hypothetical protein
MHEAVTEWVARHADTFGKVLEFGSRNINGSVRPLFPYASEFVGVDLVDGPDVDVVGDAASVIVGIDQFDVVVAMVSEGVDAMAREIGLPVIFGVLTTDTLQQTLQRAGIKSNLGWSWSYGLQALEMGSLMVALPY